MASAAPQATATATETASTEASTPAPAGSGTKIVLAGSEFGTMLFNAKQQAIYIFENDPKNADRLRRRVRRGVAARVHQGRARGGRGRQGVTARHDQRPDGGRQVTYAGKPLYYYAHEGPGQVLCHNVHLNGGLWWVVGPSGKRRP